ncbi:hypothetical protein V8E54_009368 [Elaphomyces granulatus]
MPHIGSGEERDVEAGEAPLLASLPTIPPSIAVPAADKGTSSNTQQTSESDAVHDSPQSRAAMMFLSLPNTGRLLSAGRSHLLALLRKSTHQEVPLDLLRDRWDGAVETDKSSSQREPEASLLAFYRGGPRNGKSYTV